MYWTTQTNANNDHDITYMYTYIRHTHSDNISYSGNQLLDTHRLVSTAVT